MSTMSGPGQELERRLGRLVRVVGHDLRNNLGVMGNSVYYLNMKLSSADHKVARHLEILSREIAITNRSLVDLIDLVEPKLPRPGPVELSGLVERVLEGLPPPSDGGLRTRLDLSPVPLTVRVDAEQVIRAIENVLLHRYAALAAAGNGHGAGNLLLRTRAQEGRGLIEFLDETDPATDAQLARLFDADALGAPGATSTERAGGSMHVGLVVARRLLALNQGDVTAESVASRGCCYRISLPLT